MNEIDDFFAQILSKKYSLEFWSVVSSPLVPPKIQ